MEFWLSRTCSRPSVMPCRRTAACGRHRPRFAGWSRTPARRTVPSQSPPRKRWPTRPRPPACGAVAAAAADRTGSSGLPGFAASTLTPPHRRRRAACRARRSGRTPPPWLRRLGFAFPSRPPALRAGGAPQCSPPPELKPCPLSSRLPWSQHQINRIPQAPVCQHLQRTRQFHRRGRRTCRSGRTSPWPARPPALRAGGATRPPVPPR